MGDDEELKYFLSREAKDNPTEEQLRIWRGIRTSTAKKNRYGLKRMTHKEIAEIFNVDRSTITKWLGRLLKHEKYISIYLWRCIKILLEKGDSYEDIAKGMEEPPYWVHEQLELCKNHEVELDCVIEPLKSKKSEGEE